MDLKLFSILIVVTLSRSSSILVPVRLMSVSPCLRVSVSPEEDGSHNSSLELPGSMLTSYQPVNQQRSAARGPHAAALRSPSPCFFRPSILGSASKVT